MKKKSILVEQVEHFNVERKEIVAQITDEALAIVKKSK